MLRPSTSQLVKTKSILETAGAVHADVHSEVIGKFTV